MSLKIKQITWNRLAIEESLKMLEQIRSNPISTNTGESRAIYKWVEENLLRRRSSDTILFVGAVARHIKQGSMHSAAFITLLEAVSLEI